MSKNNVSVRFHDIVAKEKATYSNNLLTFFQLESKSLEENYIIIINTELIYEQSKTKSLRNLKRMIEDLVDNEVINKILSI